VVLDGKGFQISGPVDSDDKVKALVKTAIPMLRQLEAT